MTADGGQTCELCMKVVQSLNECFRRQELEKGTLLVSK